MKRRTPQNQRLQISISVRGDKRTGKRITVTPAFLEEVLEYRLQHGEDPENVRITGVVWSHDEGTWRYETAHDIDAVMEKLKEIRHFNPGVFSIGSALLKSTPTAAEPIPISMSGKRRR